MYHLPISTNANSALFVGAGGGLAVTCIAADSRRCCRNGQCRGHEIVAKPVARELKTCGTSHGVLVSAECAEYDRGCGIKEAVHIIP
jgi:hypothetical protein